MKGRVRVRLQSWQPRACDSYPEELGKAVSIGKCNTPWRAGIRLRIFDAQTVPTDRSSAVCLFPILSGSLTAATPMLYVRTPKIF